MNVEKSAPIVVFIGSFLENSLKSGKRFRYSILSVKKNWLLAEVKKFKKYQRKALNTY